MVLGVTTYPWIMVHQRTRRKNHRTFAKTATSHRTKEKWWLCNVHTRNDRNSALTIDQAIIKSSQLCIQYKGNEAARPEVLRCECSPMKPQHLALEPNDTTSNTATSISRALAKLMSTLAKVIWIGMDNYSSANDWVWPSEGNLTFKCVFHVKWTNSNQNGNKRYINKVSISIPNLAVSNIDISNTCQAVNCQWDYALQSNAGNYFWK